MREAHAICTRFKAGFYKRFRVLRESFVYNGYGLLRGADYLAHFEPVFKG
ncbi:conserved hypothetical protein [Paraburkholderia sabiae]|nr:conserved hypothetical protein [Paraburkholderia sabiae]